MNFGRMSSLRCVHAVLLKPVYIAYLTLAEKIKAYGGFLFSLSLTMTTISPIAHPCVVMPYISDILCILTSLSQCLVKRPLISNHAIHFAESIFITDEKTRQTFFSSCHIWTHTVPMVCG